MKFFETPSLWLERVYYPVLNNEEFLVIIVVLKVKLVSYFSTNKTNICMLSDIG